MNIEELTEQYAKGLGFDPNHLSAEQEHAVEEALAKDGLLKKALPGAGAIASQATPNIGKKRGRKGATASPDSRIETKARSLALQGKEVGDFLAAVFDRSIEMQFEEMAGNFNLPISKYGSMSAADFLSE